MGRTEKRGTELDEIHGYSSRLGESQENVCSRLRWKESTDGKKGVKAEKWACGGEWMVNQAYTLSRVPNKH